MSVTTARGLRKKLTDAERRLWSRLRLRQLNGLKFRRQAPIGPYVVDFLCLERRLVIEVDGGQHAVMRKARPTPHPNPPPQGGRGRTGLFRRLARSLPQSGR